MFNTIQNHIKGWLLFALMLLPGISSAEESGYQPGYSQKYTHPVTEYIIGIHPLHNPQRLMEVYGPIADYINSHIPEVRFKIEASRNYEEFEKKLYAGHFAFAMPNPYQTILSMKHGYRIFGKMGNDEVFRGIILLRKDSDIHEVSDLKGKAVSYPAATALAATMMPQYYLHTHGIDVNRDIENRYVGSQESSIMNVLRGRVAAGATWSVPWTQFSAQNPDMANQLIVKWQTEPLLNNGWVVYKEVPKPIADQFARLLFDLHKNEAGKIILNRLPISHFEPATNETYRPVLDFLKKFSETVRPIDY